MSALVLLFNSNFKNLIFCYLPLEVENVPSERKPDCGKFGAKSIDKMKDIKSKIEKKNHKIYQFWTPFAVK